VVPAGYHRKIKIKQIGAGLYVGKIGIVHGLRLHTPTVPLCSKGNKDLIQKS